MYLVEHFAKIRNIEMMLMKIWYINKNLILSPLRKNKYQC